MGRGGGAAGIMFEMGLGGRERGGEGGGGD